MPRIQVLPPEIVNRIAAGECVERPASVVKELVENALDAGAQRVEVSVVEGGRDLIQVTDDGLGMDADDLRMCVESHATSKLRDDADLFNIHTLGFRGEALPSIGSVSRMTITSRVQSCDAQGRRVAAEIGHTLRVEGGAISGPTPGAAPPGTTVLVEDLFYNTPARRKFLRSPQTESGQITEQFVRLALAQPGVALTLRHGTRVTHRLEAAPNPVERVAALFTPELAGRLLPVERRAGGAELRGWAAPPSESRGSGKWEYLFVNGRFVRDRFMSHAVKEAYRSLIDPSRYPVVFLFLTIEPDQVDVNVHPTKVEVRWRDGSFIHGLVLAALRERFLTTPLDRGLRPAAIRDDERERVRHAMVDFFTRAAPAAPGRAWPAAPEAVRVRAEAPALDAESLAAAAVPDVLPAMITVGPTIVQDARSEADPLPAAAPAEWPAATPAAGPALHALPRAVQIHRTYLVAETDDGLMIIDQHALHERILYEQLRARVTRRPLESQRLLIPEIMSVPGDRLEALEAHAETLARLGIELAPSGPASVTLHAFPSFLTRVDREAFVRDLLDLLSDAGARPETDTLLHRVLDMMACKAAVKAGDELNADEIAALLSQRELSERSSNCPHGRPTTLRLSIADLERQFKRR